MAVNTLTLARALAETLQTTVDADTFELVHGGSISQAWRVPAGHGVMFVKSGLPEQGAAFEAECAGLNALRTARAIRVPGVLAVRTTAACSFIALEWLELQGNSERSDALLGERLAQQHRTTADRFGWERDNTIGSTMQRNDRRECWIDFLREQRLAFQLRLAESRQGSNIDRMIDRGYLLCDCLSDLFDGYAPVASLLHGDLWSGNRGTTTSGEPVVFDPAVYFGDREADLAMTRLFGGFGAAFYAAYQTSWPTDPGATVRVDLYNLYHVLNHFNMFGGAYGQQARAMCVACIERLLAHLGR